MYTLTSFITNELEKYNIPITKKNLAKLRNKYTKYLKKLGLWETAETKLVGRAQTKIFKEKDLAKIAKNFEPYMTKLLIKTSPYSKKEIETYSKNLQGQLEDNDQDFIKNLDSTLKNNNNEENIFTATQSQQKKALNELMLEAIFSHFFTMTSEQKKTFEKDISATNLDPELNTKNPQYLISMKRLQNKHKLGTYYNLKSETAKKQSK